MVTDDCLITAKRTQWQDNFDKYEHEVPHLPSGLVQPKKSKKEGKKERTKPKQK